MISRPVHWPLAGLLLACGCGTITASALRPAGVDAQRIADLFWIMAAGGAVVWALVMATAIIAVRGTNQPSERAMNRFIAIGGVVVPTTVLTALLVVGLWLLPRLLETGAQPTVRVSGEQWWWRIEQRHRGQWFALANELRVPVGVRTTLALESPDVVHALWVPALAGKIDAIPGQTTLLSLEPTEPGTYRGLCAEYCGVAHARMVLVVVAMEPQDYERWARQQAAPAVAPSTEPARRGQQAFVRHGCGACHTVRGTAARGGVGPDLTHVGSRAELAGVLPNDEAGFERWLTAPAEHKPHVHMPAFDMLPPADIRSIAAYLEALQ